MELPSNPTAQCVRPTQIGNMKASDIIKLIGTAISKHLKPLLIGKPGVGKSDVVAQACAANKADMVLMHPAVADPTDFKGMPALVDGGKEATFLPFGDLNRLVKAKKPTVAFMDDIGQAAPAVQAALMQLVLARAVNGTKISEHVTFVGATNDTSHMAGVCGMIEPLKSRWDTMVHFEVDTNDWVAWAHANGMPPLLVAFIRNQPSLLSDFKPTKELKNSPSPRGWASVGRWANAGVKDPEVLAGAVGEAAATKFCGFARMASELPPIDACLMQPDTTKVPTDPSAMIWVATGLGAALNASNIDRGLRYLERMEKEYQVMAVLDAVNRDTKNTLQNNRAYTEWAIANQTVMGVR